MVDRQASGTSLESKKVTMDALNGTPHNVMLGSRLASVRRWPLQRSLKRELGAPARCAHTLHSRSRDKEVSIPRESRQIAHEL